MPRRKNDTFFDDLRATFMKVPPWVCVPVAVLFFFAVNGSILAVSRMNAVTKKFAEIVPLAGYIVGGLALLAGLAAAIARKKRQQLFDSQTGIESIRALTWSQFEQLIGEAYRRQSYEVQENFSGGADGGVDLRLRREGETTLVQCKQWKAYKVPVQTVRELYGVMMAEGAERGILVTSGVFTHEAKVWAEGKPLELIEGEGLCRLIGHIQPVQTAASNGVASATAEMCCPLCRKKMVLRTAKKGANAGSQFWGCSGYPACRGTRQALS